MDSTTDRVVAFLYLLLRDKLPAGDVETLVTEATTALEPGPVRLVNPYLAGLAHDYAERLREASSVDGVKLLTAGESLERIVDELMTRPEIADAYKRHELASLASAIFEEVAARRDRNTDEDGARVGEGLIIGFNRLGLVFSTAYRLDVIELCRRHFYAPAVEAPRYRPTPGVEAPPNVA